MKDVQYIGMGIMLLSFLGLIGIICLAGLLISVASNSNSFSWAVFKEGQQEGR